jgi:hypothetical protein
MSAPTAAHRRKAETRGQEKVAYLAVCENLVQTAIHRLWKIWMIKSVAIWTTI